MTRRSKALPYRSHDDATVASFRDDPEFAAEYLNAVLEDGDQRELTRPFTNALNPIRINFRESFRFARAAVKLQRAEHAA